MLDIKDYFKLRKDIDAGFVNESFGYLIFQGSIYAVTKRFSTMTKAQTKACLEFLVKFRLVRFTNDVSTENLIPGIRLRVKKFRPNQKCDPSGVFDQITVNWNELQERFTQVSETQKKAFEVHMSVVGSGLWPYMNSKKQGGKKLGKAFFQSPVEFKVAMDMLSEKDQ